MEALLSPTLLKITSADPLGHSSFLVSELWFLLFLQIVYSYYLDWNILTLFIRLAQMVWLARTVGNPQQRQPATNFLCITNCYVIFMHLISRGHPFSINFIGKTVRASFFHLFLVDSIVALLELLMLHLLATVPPSTSRRTMPLWNYLGTNLAPN